MPFWPTNPLIFLEVVTDLFPYLYQVRRLCRIEVGSTFFRASAIR